MFGAKREGWGGGGTKKTADTATTKFLKIPHVAVVQSTDTEYQTTLSQPLSSFLPSSNFFYIIRQPSDKLSFCFPQDFRNFVSSTEISPLSPYPHTFPSSHGYHLIS
jgi:hypothetical protein